MYIKTEYHDSLHFFFHPKREIDETCSCSNFSLANSSRHSELPPISASKQNHCLVLLSVTLASRLEATRGIFSNGPRHFELRSELDPTSQNFRTSFLVLKEAFSIKEDINLK
ncbi:hypothetical protein AVEN_168214-1 [Araneus ventricosus]|uniref:Uncharacterized protein n=1 Tax=Araneus ventricosus TaxID=182803 RepID=A0A4Y2NA70_ARAVE|nr:hypothetical protein AVEN_168214-1 [Araneus ventricosus]